MVLAIVSCLVVSACASTSPRPRVNVVSRVPANAAVGIVGFRDCVGMLNGSDCRGSGAVAARVYEDALGANGKLRVTAVPRPVPATQPLSDQAAIELGREQHVDFVVNAEVVDFYRPVTAVMEQVVPGEVPVPNRVRLTVRLLRVSDGAVVATQKEEVEGGRFEKPAEVVRRLAARLRDAV